jgi:DNA repair exonuclease SbcCD nuclease subunit/ABC-type Na+ transport system ATPase subunit NatA
MRIAHISDIHIRGMQRHAEYRQAFESFYERCREQQVNAIFVGGDIWHTKTQGITPEAVHLITDFFKSMAEIAPVYVTLGNHDGILSNASRLDAITPIISAIGSSTRHPIMLCKKSGVYPMHVSGYNLCVFSCFDEEGWDNVKPVPGNINIAAFHGGIAGCLLDTDMEYQADTTIDLFDGFDVALLGDIHRMQFLSYKQVRLLVSAESLHEYPGANVLGSKMGLLEIETPMPWIGYSGSILQQNYGEGLPKGFLIWDIPGPGSHKVWFEEVETPDKYVTIKWQGSVDSTARSQGLAEGCRVRLVCDSSCSPQDERQLHEELRLKWGIREFVSKREKKDTAVVVTDVISEDLHSPQTHIKLIKELVRDYHTQEEWDLAEDIVCKALGEAGDKAEDARGVTWSVSSLEFDDIFTYAGGNSVSFADMTGVTGIFGPNRIGKSSIIGALVYCLFNTTDRGSMKNIHVIRSGQQGCSVKAEILVGDRQLRIERSSTLKYERNGRIWAPTTLKFTDSNDNASGEQRSDTEKIIRRSIGTAEDFFMTALSAQGTMNRFIDEGATSRKSYLGRFLDLDIFDQVLETIKPDANSVKARLKAMPDRDWTAAISAAQTKISAADAQIAQIDESVGLLHAERKRLQEQMLADAGQTQVVTQDDLERISRLISRRERELETAKARKTSAETRKSSAAAKIAAIDELKQQVDITTLRSQLKTHRDLEGQVKDLATSLRLAKSSHQTAVDDAAVLSEIPCGDSFPTCKFIKRSFLSRDAIETHKKAAEDAEAALKSSQEALRLLAGLDIEEKITRYHSAVSREQDLAASIVASRDEIKAADEAVARAVEALAESKQEYKEAQRRAEDPGSAELIRIKERLDAISEEIDALGLTRGKEQSQIAKTQTEIESLQTGQGEFKELKRLWRVYETLVTSYSKKGLPSQILDKLLPAVNQEIAEILAGVVNFTVQLEIDAETNALEIYIDYGDSRRIIELASGMEKMISSIAIRVALTRITTLPKPDFIIIDEGFGSLDETQLQACSSLIRSLRRSYRFILVISHVDAIKDAVDRVIEITRVDGASRVQA